ncbi:ygeX [Symbiodinium sp. CCMP2592]|nr:ygeX [Symbiodinium sp. CCMP2592]
MKKRGVLSICLDVRGSYELVRCKVVLGDWSIRDIVLDLAPSTEKTALAKMEQLHASLVRFADGDAAFMADGERVEGLGVRLAKELVSRWVLAYPKDSEKSQKNKDNGGFARALRNSPKLAAKFEVAETVTCNLVPIYKMLVEIRAARGSSSQWAERLLGLFRPGSLAQSAFHINCLRSRLVRLFSFRDEQGKLQKPLVLDPAHSTGYVQALQGSWNLMETQALTSEGRMIFYSAGGSAQDVLSWAACELGSIWNAITVYLQGITAEHDYMIASALQPFDTTWWQHRDDESLCCAYSV